MKKNLTISDIAAMAGVAKSTVSRYFNGGYVKESTKDKIRAIIEEHQYEPNAFARLKAKKSNIIGVIAPCLDSAVASSILMGIDERLREEGCTSLIINTNHNSSLELKHMSSLERMRVDGIIIIATVVSEEHARLAEEMKLPVLFIGQRYEKGISIVNSDYEAGRSMAERIAACGHDSVLYISVSEADEAVGVIRRRGILEGLCEHRLKVRECVSDFSRATTEELLRQELDKELPSVILCSATRQMLAAYKVLKEKGLDIPKDVAVCGFGGYDFADVLSPALTVIQFDSHKTGTLGAETMLQMMRGEDVEPIQKIEYEFYEGGSMIKRS